ncbi:MAG: methionine synthase [Acidobacteriota bacterium]|nr:methionine synthase [Blastocatellia bacterium]MDW8411376.1 methionine synthase [Acidobacteriota bacterium]
MKTHKVTSFARLLQERILVLDGAMGTTLQAMGLTAADYGGSATEGCPEILVLTRPDVIERVHRGYLEVGADIIETNTFGATSVVLAEYGLQRQVVEINKRAVELAKRLCEEYSTPEKPRFVAGSMGPTTKSLSLTGGITFDELCKSYYQQAKALVEAGVDILLLETALDTLNLKAGAIAIKRLFEERGEELPLHISATIERTGRAMLAGQGVEALYTSIRHFRPVCVGLNCATGPRDMTDHIRSLAVLADTAVSCVPNAGVPQEGIFPETPQMMAEVLAEFIDNGWINMIGGCCGTTVAHIELMSQLAKERRPRRIPRWEGTHVSGIEHLKIEEDARPYQVGERMNVLGSREFKRLIAEGKYEEAAEIGRAQVRAGAAILDVCLQDPDRDELADALATLQHLVRKVKVPIMIDSTDHRVFEQALKLIQGKAILNSINLENGEERFQSVCPLARRYGAALVVGTIDEDPEQGMGVTVERKLEIAERSYALLTGKYGIEPEDIIFDPLVFPVGTGDAKYIGSAEQTLKAITAIKQRFPKTKTILGISNISFGLPTAGREVLNSVFLYHAVKAGLDLAIVNTQRLERYPSIPAEQRKLCEDLIFWRGSDPVAAFSAYFKERHKTVVKKEHKTCEQRLVDNIVQGSKEGLFDNLKEALGRYSPLEIINGPLMDGMNEVGRLFNNNELIVAEVLQSAEVMKAAVAFLEPLMPKGGATGKGRVILATVKGDVHDIGKNLVEIILANNGYEVINLGIKVTSDRIIEAVREYNPQIIGLSGLLVKSTHEMVNTARDLKAVGISVPIMVGGAALTKKFTLTRIMPEYDGLVVYAKDAMQGLELANRIVAEPEQLIREWKQQQVVSVTPRREIPKEKQVIDWNVNINPAPDYLEHIEAGASLQEIWELINPKMLYNKHLGYRGNFEEHLKAGVERAVKLYEQVEAVKEEVVRSGLFRPQAIYRFFKALSKGDSIVVIDGLTGVPLEEFHFPRQSSGARLCLSDFVRGGDVPKDDVAFFVTTCGAGIREQAEELKTAGEYLKSHILQALAIESAEAYAELLHKKLRRLWGIPDDPAMTREELFAAEYQGIRVSFGYPACPRLEDQAILWRLLRPERIGVELTDGYMMDPEASVSAMVFQHPQARYFAISAEDLAAFEKKLSGS